MPNVIIDNLYTVEKTGKWSIEEDDKKNIVFKKDGKEIDIIGDIFISTAELKFEYYEISYSNNLYLYTFSGAINGKLTFDIKKWDSANAKFIWINNLKKIKAEDFTPTFDKIQKAYQCFLKKIPSEPQDHREFFNTLTQPAKVTSAAADLKEKTPAPIPLNAPLTVKGPLKNELTETELTLKNRFNQWLFVKNEGTNDGPAVDIDTDHIFNCGDGKTYLDFRYFNDDLYIAKLNEDQSDLIVYVARHGSKDFQICPQDALPISIKRSYREQDILHHLYFLTPLAYRVKKLPVNAEQQPVKQSIQEDSFSSVDNEFSAVSELENKKTDNVEQTVVECNKDVLDCREPNRKTLLLKTSEFPTAHATSNQLKESQEVQSIELTSPSAEVQARARVSGYELPPQPSIPKQDEIQTSESTSPDSYTLKKVLMDEIQVLKENIEHLAYKRKTRWYTKEKLARLQVIADWIEENEAKNPSQILAVIRDVCTTHRHPKFFGGWGQTHSSKEFNSWFIETFQKQFPNIPLPTAFSNKKDLKNAGSIKELLNTLQPPSLLVDCKL